MIIFQEFVTSAKHNGDKRFVLLFFFPHSPDALSILWKYAPCEDALGESSRRKTRESCGGNSTKSHFWSSFTTWRLHDLQGLVVVALGQMKAIFLISVLSTPGLAGSLPNSCLEGGMLIVVKERASQVFGKMNHNNKIKPCLRWVLYKEVRYSLASKLLQKVKVPSTVLSTNHFLAWPAMGTIPHWTVDAYFWAKRLTCSM